MSRTFEQLTAEQRDTIQQLNEQHFTQTGIDSLYKITMSLCLFV